MCQSTSAADPTAEHPRDSSPHQERLRRRYAMAHTATLDPDLRRALCSAIGSVAHPARSPAFRSRVVPAPDRLRTSSLVGGDVRLLASFDGLNPLIQSVRSLTQLTCPPPANDAPEFGSSTVLEPEFEAAQLPRNAPLCQ